ncbi:MAG: site-2 protease family protein [Candidatus Sumerlaeaceae bacterium]|nr:site-2 protease family protein [Candidatus Sumerlaeaceae bacterium]
MSLDPQILLFIPIFLFALTFHEFAHAWAAKKAGDMTAAYAGRLTLNPIAHIDPIGTIVLPLAALLLNFPMIGWAKPVPVNQLRFRKEIWFVWVSLAGPASNFLLAFLGAVGIKILLSQFSLENDLARALVIFAAVFVKINLVLAIFNMLPIPPLDGSSLLYHFFVRRIPGLWNAWIALSAYGFLILWALIVFFPPAQRLLQVAFSLPANILLSWAMAR